MVVGFGGYADNKYNLGIDDTINIPIAIDKIASEFTSTSKNTIEGKINPVAGKEIRIIMQQFYKNGDPCRSWPGAPPDGKNINEVIVISVSQDGKPIPMHIEYDKMIWSGLSWGAGEIKHSDIDMNKPT